MSRLPATLILAALALMASATATAAPPADVSGGATVLDGDTLDISGVRIRFYGVDAPEKSQWCFVKGEAGKGWPCGQVSKQALTDAVRGKTVVCQAKNKDPYGRTVAVCSVNGVDLNRWMVRNGNAVAYAKYSTAYVNDEIAARRSGTGMWAGVFQAPWDYRHKGK